MSYNTIYQGLTQIMCEGSRVSLISLFYWSGILNYCFDKIALILKNKIQWNFNITK